MEKELILWGQAFEASHHAWIFVVVLGSLGGYNGRHFVNRVLNPVDLEVPCDPHFIAKGTGVLAV